MPSTSDENRELLSRRLANDGSNRRHIVIVESAAECIGQQLLGQRADKHIGPLQERLSKRGGAVDAGSVGELA